MQKNEQSLLLIHRENYNVPKGQEQSVHCKIAKMDDKGNILDGAKLVRFGVKKFETYLKTNLELMGYTVEILHHPLGRYSNVTIKDKNVEIQTRDAEIAALKARLAENDTDKDAIIARLERELAEAKAKASEGAEEKKKGGRPRKEE